MKKMLSALALVATASLSTAGRAQMCETDTTNTKPEPFAFANFTWLNGNPRTALLIKL